jgi:hypothetical protein
LFAGEPRYKTTTTDFTARFESAINAQQIAPRRQPIRFPRVVVGGRKWVCFVYSGCRSARSNGFAMGVSAASGLPPFAYSTANESIPISP